MSTSDKALRYRVASALQPDTVGQTVAPAGHTHDAGDISSGLLDAARLAEGVGDATTFLRGDRTWAVPAGGDGGGTAAAASGGALALLSTTAVGPASGPRQVVFDTVVRSDTGWVADAAVGTLTAPETGWYAIAGHAHYSTAPVTQTALTIRVDGVIVLRSHRGNYTGYETDVTGVVHLTAGQVVTLWIDSSASLSYVGNDVGSNVYLRAVNIGASPAAAGGGDTNTLAHPPVRPTAGRWYLGTSGNFASKAVTTDLTFHPISFSRDVTITQIGLYVSGAGVDVTALRLGIYNSRDTDGLPGTVALDAGVVNATSVGVKNIALGTPVTLTAGRLYWTCHTANAVGASGYGAVPTWDLGRSSVTSNATHALLLANPNGPGGALPEITTAPTVANQGAYYAMPVLYAGSVA